MEKVRRINVKIDILDTPKEHVQGLILGLAYSGYDTYFDYEKEHICFTGWYDEIVEEINSKDD